MRDLSARIEQQLARVAEHQTLASRWRSLEDERARLENELRVLADRSDSDEDAMRTALQQLRAIETERNTTVAAMNERSAAEDELFNLLEAKAQSLIAAGDRLSPTIEESARTIITLRQRLQLIEDAIVRADVALATVQELLDSLSAADGWSMLDFVVDGAPGAVVSALEHRVLRQAAEIAERARASIKHLAERIFTSGDQLTAADILSNLTDAADDVAILARGELLKGRADDCAARLRAILRSLHGSARALDADLRDATATRRALLLNA